MYLKNKLSSFEEWSSRNSSFLKSVSYPAVWTGVPALEVLSSNYFSDSSMIPGGLGYYNNIPNDSYTPHQIYRIPEEWGGKNNWKIGWSSGNSLNYESQAGVFNGLSKDISNPIINDLAGDSTINSDFVDNYVTKPEPAFPSYDENGNLVTNDKGETVYYDVDGDETTLKHAEINEPGDSFGNGLENILVSGVLGGLGSGLIYRGLRDLRTNRKRAVAEIAGGAASYAGMGITTYLAFNQNNVLGYKTLFSGIGGIFTGLGTSLVADGVFSLIKARKMKKEGNIEQAWDYGIKGTSKIAGGVPVFCAGYNAATKLSGWYSLVDIGAGNLTYGISAAGAASSVSSIISGFITGGFFGVIAGVAAYAAGKLVKYFYKKYKDKREKKEDDEDAEPEEVERLTNSEEVEDYNNSLSDLLRGDSSSLSEDSLEKSLLNPDYNNQLRNTFYINSDNENKINYLTKILEGKDWDQIEENLGSIPDSENYFTAWSELVENLYEDEDGDDLFARKLDYYLHLARVKHLREFVDDNIDLALWRNLLVEETEISDPTKSAKDYVEELNDVGKIRFILDSGIIQDDYDSLESFSFEEWRKTISSMFDIELDVHQLATLIVHEDFNDIVSMIYREKYFDNSNDLSNMLPFMIVEQIKKWKDRPDDETTNLLKYFYNKDFDTSFVQNIKNEFTNDDGSFDSFVEHYNKGFVMDEEGLEKKKSEILNELGVIA